MNQQIVLVRHWEGLGLSLLTAMLWGILPVFLQICLQAMDSSTITWFRFFVAAVFVYCVLVANKALPTYRQLKPRVVWILLVASLALVANYVANVHSLEYVSPETVQVVMQVAPLLLMLGGVVFFKEQFNRYQLFGAFILLSGLMLFFNQRLPLLFSELNRFNIGVLVVIFAAVMWVGYALLQKSLLRSFTARQLTLSLYCIGIVTLMPFASLDSVLSLNLLQASALLFCCVNTIIAYGAFTEALNIWSASKVSAVIATGPLFTFVSVLVAERFIPEFFQSSLLNLWSVVGALCVITGSMTIALAKQKA